MSFHPVLRQLLPLLMVIFGLAVPTITNADPDCRQSGEVSVHCGEAPSAWIDSDGRLWVVFAMHQHAWLSVSEDRGLHFSEPVRVNSAPENIEVNGENRPKIVVDEQGGAIYVSWTQKTEGQHTGDIRFTRSVDGGSSFEPVRTINDDGLLTSHRFESLFLAQSGHLYVTWLDKRELEYAALRGEPYTGSGVFFTVSTDQGATFASNRKIADHSCECCRIAVAPHGEDGMALLWRHVFDDTTRDHAIASVSAQGVSTPLSRASVDDWQINACPHHGPSMALSSDISLPDTYHLTWFSAGNINKGIHYGRHSLGSGHTDHVMQVDGSPGTSHPQIAEWQGVQYLVWKRFDGIQTELLLIQSDNQGLSWSDERVIAYTGNASDHPLIIPSADGLSVSWLTRAEGYQLFALPAPAPQIRPFLADTFAAIKAQREGQAFLLALWSVDCPPCMVELNMLGKLRKEFADLPLVLISTDQIRLREDAEDFLLDYELDDMPSWMFADEFTERLRFSIDPQWFGELPRSYYFDAEHQHEAHSGILSERQVRAWLGL
jgi:hypothetical protein